MSFAVLTAMRPPAPCVSRCTKMPIPTKFDGDVGAVANLSDSVLNQLRTMQHAAVRDLPRMRERLRSTLQEYAVRVMDVARTE